VWRVGSMRRFCRLSACDQSARYPLIVLANPNLRPDIIFGRSTFMSDEILPIPNFLRHFAKPLSSANLFLSWVPERRASQAVQDGMSLPTHSTRHHTSGPCSATGRPLSASAGFLGTCYRNDIRL
jgi:hypothetical protein